MHFPHLYCKIKISRIFKAPKGVGWGMCYEQDAAPPRCFPNQSSIFRILLDQWFLTFLKIHFRINPFAAGLVRQWQRRLTGKRRRPRKGRLVQGQAGGRGRGGRPARSKPEPAPAPGHRGRQGAPGTLDPFPLLCAFGSATWWLIQSPA